MNRALILLLALLVNTGCASSRGFDRGAIKADLSSPITTDRGIQKTLELKPQLPFPFRLGVYFIDRRSYRQWDYGSKWGANDRDLDWLDPLKEVGIVSEVIPVTSAAMTNDGRESTSLTSIRLAAARHNADAVLTINYGADVDRYNNFSSFLYLTIIGGFLVPGTHANALVVMNGALWDVRNEYLYITAEAEAEAGSMGPAFLLKNGKSVRKAKGEAMPLFHEEVVKRIRALAGN